MKYDLSKFTDKQLAELVENRWASSQTMREEIKKIYDTNTANYENKASCLSKVPHKRPKVQANRVFVNMEAVINSIIANIIPLPPTI